MLAPKPPSDPSKLPPLCRIFEGRTSKILLDFAAIFGTHETCRVSGSIWKTSSEFTHGPEIYNCIILKVLTFTYPVSQIIMHRNVLYFGKERNWKSSKLKVLDIATSCVRIVFLKNNPFFPSVTLQWQQRNPNEIYFIGSISIIALYHLLTGAKVNYNFLYDFMPKISTDNFLKKTKYDSYLPMSLVR